MKLTTNDCEKELQDELSDDIERIMISVISVLAAAAGLDRGRDTQPDDVL